MARRSTGRLPHRPRDFISLATEQARREGGGVCRAGCGITYTAKETWLIATGSHLDLAVALPRRALPLVHFLLLLAVVDV